MLGALTVLPALLAVLGPRVDSLRFPFLGRRRPADPTAEPHGAWYRLARSVMRRPVAYVAVIVPFLLLAGLPFLRVEFGGVDHRSLPEGT
jgi:trehalose monomycolate/heme transporter